MKNLIISKIFVLVLFFGLLGCQKDAAVEPEAPMPTINGLTYQKDFYDTDVLKQSFRVYSKTNLTNSNKTAFTVKLPPNTVYWTYWYVVKQGTEEPYAYAFKTLTKAITKITSNPVTAFGLGLISNIPALQNTTETLDFYITNENYVNGFMRNGYPEKAYNFGQYPNSTNIYKPETYVPAETMYFCFNNSNLSKGLDAYIHVVAFVKK